MNNSSYSNYSFLSLPFLLKVHNYKLLWNKFRSVENLPYHLDSSNISEEQFMLNAEN